MVDSLAKRLGVLSDLLLVSLSDVRLVFRAVSAARLVPLRIIDLIPRVR